MGILKRWSGTAWEDVSAVPLKRWSGTAWETVDVLKRWSGSAWEVIYSGAPTSLDPPDPISVETIGSTTLRVHWTAVGGAAGYKVERSLNGTTGWTEFYDGGGTAADDINRNDGQEYWYRVKAYNGPVESGYSQVDSGITTLKAPTLSSLGAGSPPYSAIGVNYADNSATSTQVRVYVSTTSATSGYSYWGNFSPSNTYDQITGRPENTQHWVKLANYNSVAGVGPYSSWATWTTSLSPPDAPTNFQVDLSTCGSVYFTWNDVADNESGYRLYKKPYGTDDWGTVWHSLAANSTNAGPYSGFSLGSSWDFKIEAYNSAGIGSATLSQVVIPNVPGTPISISVSHPNDNQMYITWGGSSGSPTGYDLEVEQEYGSGSWDRLMTNVNTGNYTHTPQQATFPWGYDLGTPTLNSTPLSKTDVSITIQWTNQAPAFGTLLIYRKAPGESQFTQRGTASVSATNWQDTGLSPSSTYQYYIFYRSQWLEHMSYRVRGVNGCGPSGWKTWTNPQTWYPWERSSPVSNTVSITTDALSVPADPTNCLATDVSDAVNPSVWLDWDDNSNNEDGFKIYRSVSGGPFNYYDSTIANDYNYNDNGVSFGTTYQYRVYSYNAAGNSTNYAQSNTVTPTPGGEA